MNKPILATCPFCGAKPTLKVHPRDKYDGCIRISCENCLVEMWEINLKGGGDFETDMGRIADKWNRRKM